MEQFEAFGGFDMNSENPDGFAASGFVLTDGSGQIQYATGIDAGTPSFKVRTLGFMMLSRGAGT